MGAAFAGHANQTCPDCCHMQWKSSGSGRGLGRGGHSTENNRSDGHRHSEMATNLPHPLSDASATVHGDSVCLVGGHDQQCATEVLTCSLTSLQSLTPGGAEIKDLPLGRNHQVWHMIGDLPVKYSTCITVNEQLLAVGGQDLCNKVTNNKYTYNTRDQLLGGHQPYAHLTTLVFSGGIFW